MRLIKMTGGLGNQMFIYALYLRMKSRYPKTWIDLSDMVHYKVHHGYEMNRVFRLPHTEICLPQWLKKALEFLFFRTILERHEHGSLRHYDGKILWPLVYYKGFYQNLAYLEGHEEEIRRAFTFNMELASQQNKALASQIDAEPNSVSLHIRRGDYLKPEHYKAVGCVCQLPYYQKALRRMEELVPNPHYYVFCEDMEWVRENLPLANATYINWNRGEDSWQDMMLMTHCHHHIICNSTFSWWGVWLSSKSQTVICPDHWNAGDGGRMPIYLDNWIRIEADA
ncbi:MAG: alpha-1,2-fucosyltransferase [Bacteroidaceae bacterium]|nr:alpha-1,2-fucosyltransferase [Bacteroidaceae bacterium]